MGYVVLLMYANYIEHVCAAVSILAIQFECLFADVPGRNSLKFMYFCINCGPQYLFGSL